MEAHREDAKDARSLVRRSEIEGCAREVVDAGLVVHSALGPGLLESTYESCLTFELRSRGLDVAVQCPLPIVYRGVRIDAGYRLDMVVGGMVVVELKAVTKLLPIHEAQLLSYLRLGGYRLGFLLNFHVVLLKDGIRRLVNGL